MTLSELTHALERAYTAIRTIQPLARPALITIYRHAHGDRRGHYAPLSWLTKADADNALDEIHVDSIILNEPAESVFGTLLHEACHSIALAQNVQDTSRQGRWHNRNFAALAESVGLTVEPDKRYGYVTTGITDATKKQYKNVLAELADALTIWQQRITPGGNGTKTTQSQLRFKCQCDRLIRMSKKVYEQGPIICSLCGEPFELADD